MSRRFVPMPDSARRPIAGHVGPTVGTARAARSPGESGFAIAMGPIHEPAMRSCHRSSGPPRDQIAPVPAIHVPWPVSSAIGIDPALEAATTYGRPSEFRCAQALGAPY